MVGEPPGFLRYQKAGAADQYAPVADRDAALDKRRHVLSGSMEGVGRDARPPGDCATPLQVMPVDREDRRSREGPFEFILVDLIARTAFEKSYEVLDLHDRLVGAPAVEPAPELTRVS